MTDRWELVLPQDKPLTLNARQHHMARYRAMKEFKEATWAKAKAARIPRCERVEIQLIYEPTTKRRRDSLNLVQTLKAIEDGLVLAGVIEDDDGDHHVSVMPLVDAPTGKRGRLVVFVTRLA